MTRISGRLVNFIPFDAFPRWRVGSAGEDADPASLGGLLHRFPHGSGAGDAWDAIYRHGTFETETSVSQPASVVHEISADTFGIAGLTDTSGLSTVIDGPFQIITAPTAPLFPFPNSEADIATRAAEARAAYGVDGTGITIGVLSDSFNNLGGAGNDILNGELPASGVTVLSDLPNGGSDEGRAMLQLVHDLAPGADLMFHTAFNGATDFAQGIIDLANAGADIIVDDVFYYAEPAFQDGIIAQAVDQVTSQGVLYFSSAGNQANHSYESPFRDSGVTNLFGYGETFHDFNPGTGIDVYQSITLSPGRQPIVTFQWDQPYSSEWAPGSPGSASNIDLFLLDGSLNLLGGFTASEIGGAPWMGFQFNPVSTTTTFNLAIGVASGPDPGLMRVSIFGSGLTINEYATGSATIFGHSNAEGTLAVGAADYNDTPAYGVSPPLLEYFSSLGGTPILFDDVGNRLAAPIIRDNVDFVAPDGTTTTISALSPFYGTSAAAPHAAAVAALMLEYNPDATQAQIEAALEAGAIDMDNPYTAGFDTGFDRATGAGLVQADAALAALGPPAGNNPPVATPVVAATHEDAVSLSVDLLAGASDPDPGDVLSVTSVVQTGGPTAAFTVGSGLFELDPGQFNWLSAGQSQGLTFDYTVSDQAATATSTLTVTVDGRNDATTDLQVSATSFDENAAFSATLSAVDPDLADSFTYGLTSDPTGGAFEVAGDQLSLVAPLDFEALPAGFADNGDGTATVTLGLSADDGNGSPLVKNVAFTVNDIAEAPPAGSEQVVEVRVASGLDDVEERFGGRMYTNSTDLELIEDHSPQTVGIRFEGMGIPQGAVITSAYIQFQVDEVSTAPADLVIHGQASDDAASFGYSSGDVSGRATTAASAAWQPEAWDTVGAAGAAQQTSDLSAIVQEVVDRAGWTPDNGMAFIFTGSGKRVAESFEGDSAGAPLLHVEYTMPGSGGAGPTDLLVSTAAFDENAAFAATLTAVDADSTVFTYGLASDPTSGAFQVTGDQLSLAAPLDFETLPAGFADNGDGTATVTLGLSADDGSNPPYVKDVAFTVSDLNDNAPTNIQVSAHSFDENAAFNATLSAVDADSASVNAFTYGLASDPTGAFQVVGDQLSLIAPLDFEALPSGFADNGDGTATAILGLSVNDGANPAHVKDVAFTVGDVNDNAPVVVPVTATTNEDAAPLSLDLLAGASDPDVGDVLSISSVVQTGGPTTVFTVTNGVLEVDPGQFNGLGVRESQALTFAFDVSDQVHTTPGAATVTVEGRNDAPVPTLAAAGTSEDMGLHSVDLLTYVNDPDVNDVLSVVDVVQTGGPATVFAITSTGFEFDTDQFNWLSAGEFALPLFDYYVTDQTVTVGRSMNVSVFGINDPTTDFQVSATTFDENVAFSATLNAIDPDLSDTFTYRIVSDPTGAFRVNGNQVSLRPLDFEALPAGFTDNGDGTATATVRLSATDGASPAVVKDVAFTVNDVPESNTPPVVGPVGILTNEDHPVPISVDLVSTASDPDPGDVLSLFHVFQTSGPLMVFTVTDTSIEFSADQFNWMSEGQTVQMTFDYIITDQIATSKETLTITVDGRNDATTDLLVSGGKSFDENAGFFAIMSPVDPDIADTFLFGIPSDPTGAFQIIGNQLLLTAPLDFEALPGGFIDNGDGTATVTLGLSATDGASPPVVKNVDFTINDLNDNAPKDIQVSASNFNENAAFSATLSAVDADSAAVNSFTYALASDPTGGAFHVGGDQLSLIGPLDFEALPGGFADNGDGTATVVLELSVNDGASPAYVKNVAFTVSDLNDNAPTDLQVSANSFDENAAFSATLAAVDGDSATVNAFTYGLANDPTGGAFQVIDDQLSLTAPLDFENLPAGFSDNGNGTAGVTLGLSVSDGAHPALVKNVAFTVNDVPENDPPVVPKLFWGALEDNLPVSINILARAHDPNPGDVLSISSFAQTGGPSANFTVTNGIFELDTTQFDWVSAGQLPTLTFDYSVTDQIATTTSTLELTIIGQNDPTTGLQASTASFDENATFSATLTAIDRDLADTFTYGLTRDPSGVFQLAGDQLSMVAPLDFENLPPGFVVLGNGTATVTLGLSATDGASPVVTENVTFTVNDLPDAAPTELHASSTTFDENGAFNATLSAVNGSSAAFTYTLVGDPTGGAFQVAGDQLSLTAPLDFEAPPAGFTDNGNGTATVTLQISADDGTNPAFVKNLALMVNDLNDNAPTGLWASGSGSVEDGNGFFFAPSPRSPDTLIATDADSDAANDLTYTLTSDPTGGAFQIVGNEFFKTAPLDFEALPPGFTLISADKATVDLEITIDDGVHPPVAQIFQFQVNDRNDNSPTDLLLSATSFDENAAFSATLSAVDPDSAPVNNFSYELLNDPTGGAFQIVGDQLSLVAPLDFEALPPGFSNNGDGTASVMLWVSVNDGATPAPTKSVTLTINDIAEAPPGGPPQVVEVRVASGLDDVEERFGGRMYTNSTDLELIEDHSPQTVGIRFAGTGIPQGAVITSAYIQFQVDEVSTAPADLVIHGQASDDAASFGYSSGDVSGRATTAASAAWQPEAWDTVGAAGAAQQTSDLSAIVQEVVDQGGWAPDNGMAFIFTGSGKRVAESFEGDSDGAALLHVEYTVPSTSAFDPAAATNSIALAASGPAIPIDATHDAGGGDGTDDTTRSVSPDGTLGGIIDVGNPDDEIAVDISRLAMAMDGPKSMANVDDDALQGADIDGLGDDPSLGADEADQSADLDALFSALGALGAGDADSGSGPQDADHAAAAQPTAADPATHDGGAIHAAAAGLLAILDSSPGAFDTTTLLTHGVTTPDES